MSTLLNVKFFCCSDLSLFTLLMKQSHQPNIGILGIPIGDLDFCTTFISHKHCLAKQLMQQIEEVGALDPQVAIACFFALVVAFAN